MTVMEPAATSKEEILTTLRTFKKKNEVEDYFKMLKIDNFQQKTTYLRNCMKIQHEYAAPDPSGQDETDEDTYYDDLEFFADGNWRQFV